MKYQIVKKTLYKKDTKGRIRILNISALNGELIQESGLEEGKLIEHRKKCKAKNIGKANYRDELTQADLEAKALIVKKLKEGYFEERQDAVKSNVMLPMLAKDYFKEQHKLKGRKLMVQPKLDGVRCVVTHKFAKATAISRNNRPIENIDHILKEIEMLMHENINQMIFDGELYKHGDTFQEVVTLVKNKPDPNNLIEYHIYDSIDTVRNFEARNKKLKALFKKHAFKYIKLVPTKEVPEGADLESFYEDYIKDGYEGMMVRTANSNYKVNGRSSDLLKYKKFIDIALPIVDITPNDVNPMHGTVWVEYNGKWQKTGAKLSHKEREQLLANKDDFIGKTAEIRYFEETDEGLLRFPVYHGIRIDK